MKVAVLAVQGAFIEHINMLKKLGIDSFEIRQEKDLEEDFDGIILPGGESTVMGKLLKELNLFDTLLEKIKSGMPVLGTCAGLILLAEKLSNYEKAYFKTLPVTVKRNAYGRQLGSFQTVADVKGVGEIPLTFIRAPYIESVQDGVDIIATVDNNIVGVRYKNQLGISFHPELTNDLSIHKYFIQMIEESKNK